MLVFLSTIIYVIQTKRVRLVCRAKTCSTLDTLRQARSLTHALQRKIVRRTDQQSSERVGFPHVRSLYRHRSQSFPPVVPNSLQEFAEILQQPQYSELGRSISEDGEAYPLFRGLIGRGGKQGWSAAAYLSARMQDALSNSRRIHMDATFKVLPLQLGILLQLLTVHVEYLNCFFSVAFVIMTRKTQQAYEGVLRYCTSQLVPQWQPEIVLADF
ncbi:hypothetical protein J6590_061487 [Homalodisca vitripennis]|nr:hypothetical protein J6590_061487 [Homalodisca vitripennis]